MLLDNVNITNKLIYGHSHISSKALKYFEKKHSIEATNRGLFRKLHAKTYKMKVSEKKSERFKSSQLAKKLKCLLNY
jgi:monomeric isocitrate dehydrogenase